MSPGDFSIVRAAVESALQEDAGAWHAVVNSGVFDEDAPEELFEPDILTVRDEKGTTVAELLVERGILGTGNVSRWMYEEPHVAGALLENGIFAEHLFDEKLLETNVASLGFIPERFFLVAVRSGWDGGEFVRADVLSKPVNFSSAVELARRGLLSNELLSGICGTPERPSKLFFELLMRGFLPRVDRRKGRRSGVVPMGVGAHVQAPPRYGATNVLFLATLGGYISPKDEIFGKNADAESIFEIGLLAKKRVPEGMKKMTLRQAFALSAHASRIDDAEMMRKGPNGYSAAHYAAVSEHILPGRFPASAKRKEILNIVADDDLPFVGFQGSNDVLKRYPSLGRKSVAALLAERDDYHVDAEVASTRRRFLDANAAELLTVETLLSPFSLLGDKNIPLVLALHAAGIRPALSYCDEIRSFVGFSLPSLFRTGANRGSAQSESRTLGEFFEDLRETEKERIERGDIIRGVLEKRHTKNNRKKRGDSGGRKRKSARSAGEGTVSESWCDEEEFPVL